MCARVRLRATRKGETSSIIILTSTSYLAFVVSISFGLHFTSEFQVDLVGSVGGRFVLIVELIYNGFKNSKY